MMTSEQIQEFSKKFQIDPYSITREYLQLLFLKYFYTLKESEAIYFKGGTAIHFLYGSFRFSEDLDFTSLLATRDLKKLLDKVIQSFKMEVKNLELVPLEIKEHAWGGIIKYDHGLRYPLTIRLEFSLREKPITHRITTLETVYPIVPYPLIVTMEGEELMAEKVRALLTRHKGRDLFDLWFLLSKGIPLRKDYIQDKMLWYRLKYDPNDLMASIGKFKEENLKRDLGKFLPQNYRTFVKELKTKTLEKLGHAMIV